MVYKTTLFSIFALVTSAIGWADSSSSSSQSTAQGSWQLIANQPADYFEPPFPTAYNPLLMTSGELFVLNVNGPPYTGQAWKLTPDIYGSYENGTWTELASLPDGYAPLYCASAVLADGRIILLGGEYNGPDFDKTYTNMGAIYDPVGDFWTPIFGPSFFSFYDNSPGNPFGDSPSTILEDGSFMAGNLFNKQAAILDPETLTWRETGTETKHDFFLEAGLILLPSGKVLTKDSFGGWFEYPELFKQVPFPENALAEIYDPKKDTWSSAGYSPVNLQILGFEELGATLLRPDGTVVLLGSTENIAIYDSCNGKWKKGPKFPPFDNAQNVPKLKVKSPFKKTFKNFLLGLDTPSQNSFLINAPIVLAYPATAVPAVENDLTGAIALVDVNNFEDGNSKTKCNNAAAAGALACLLYDSSGSFYNSAQFSGSSLIPSVMTDYYTGQELLNNLNYLEGTLESMAGPLNLGAVDSPAILLPNGNTLLFASPSEDSSGNIFLSSTRVFELDKNNHIVEEPTVNSPDIPCYAISGTLLPTGQAVSCNLWFGDVEIYTPADRSFKNEWRPRIKECPSHLEAGGTYKIKGYLFNGMSQAQNVNDENNAATNYPIVRLTFKDSGHVFYCRTHDHSFMGVAATDKKVYTYFDVPTSWAGYPMETGKAKLEVIANGIPSKAFYVHVSN